MVSGPDLDFAVMIPLFIVYDGATVTPTRDVAESIDLTTGFATDERGNIGNNASGK